LTSHIFFKLANKYQINNTVMFNNLFCRFWQVINLVKKDVCHPFTFHILTFSSENPQPNELKLDRKHLWKVLSKECTSCYDPLPNMAATGNSCFWLADFFKSSLLKLSNLHRGHSIDASYQVSVVAINRSWRNEQSS
jgi:hypothetical protein